MSFDKPTRNLLASMVANCRKLLIDDFGEQLSREFGMHPDGLVLDVKSLLHLDPAGVVTAGQLREELAHLEAVSTAKVAYRRKDAYDRLVRELGFTAMNRLAALRMCEERGLIAESVRKGPVSEGVSLFSRIMNNAAGDTYATYRLYLELLFDELAVDLGVLFDRSHPSSLLFPSDPCLTKLLNELNSPALARLWAEDETIGWIYQYWNSDEERRAMRKASAAAPRDSRELAVRNQFFTPRYVVEFLSDNTLGRTWYEMRQGATSLTELCKYMVRRKRPVFLGPGDGEPMPFAPNSLAGDADSAGEMWLRPDPDLKDVQEIWRYAQTGGGDDYAKVHLGVECADLANERLARYEETKKWEGSFDELRCCLFFEQRRSRHMAEEQSSEPPEAILSLYRELCQRWDLETEFIPYRAKKLPWEISILDPAVGSGHFLLYCFDLLSTIYDEAYDDIELGLRIRALHPDRNEYRRAVPSLILANNLHGIDIDSRCVQIASLALWLRAHRAYAGLNLPRSDRPQIRRTNIVCAEPMPGEQAMLDEFIAELNPPLLAQMVRRIFEAMKLAGEAGPLLNIEDDLADAISQAKQQWLRKPAAEQGRLFGTRPRQQDLAFDTSGITDETFWAEAEEAIYSALQDYAERADEKAYERRLFVDDAARGFAFIDVSRKRYDVVLMNPPFGDITPGSANALDEQLAVAGRDIGAAFLARAGLRWSPNGFTGAVTPTAFWFKPSFTKWRETHFLGPTRSIHCAIHLGGDVLDEATVSVGAVATKPTLPTRTDTSFIVRAAKIPDKGARIVAGTDAISAGRILPDCFVMDVASVRDMPSAPLAYWISSDFRRLIGELPPLEGSGAVVKQGTATADEFRFARAWWEVPSLDSRWTPYMKTSEYSPYWDDPTWLLNFRDKGREIEATGRARVQGTNYFGSPGVTYPSKAVLGFNPRLHPSGCAFGHSGSVAFPLESSPEFLLAYLGSKTVEYLISLQIGGMQGEAGFHPNHYEVGIVQSLPFIPLSNSEKALLESSGARLVEFSKSLFFSDETSHHFVSPSRSRSLSIRDESSAQTAVQKNILDRIVSERSAVDGTIRSAIRLLDQDVDEMERAFAERIPPASGRWRIYFGSAWQGVDPRQVALDTISFAVGACLGRWGDATGKDTVSLTERAIDFPSRSRGLRLTEEQGDSGLSSFLVDDPDHPDDIVRRTIQRFDAMWESGATAIEEECCDLLEVSSLREFFRRPSGFFADHLKRYSKSRRQAPLYWPLSTASGSYTLWIYYQRLNDDLLYMAVNNYVEPKISQVQRHVTALESQLLSGATGKTRQELDDTRKLLGELQDFRTELLRIASLPYKPDLNDGILINAAPLWKLFRLPKWRKDLETCWRKLEAGEFDWARMAYNIWTDRVRKVCEQDRSIAIAQGLEHLCTATAPRRGRRAAVVVVDEDDNEDENDE